MPDALPSPLRHGRRCWNCGGSLCDGKACLDELEAFYAAREKRQRSDDGCGLCGQPLAGGVCRCETTLSGAPAFAHYDSDEAF